MERLYQLLKPLVEANWFKKLMDLTVFLNPVAILPQCLAVFTAPSVEGISIGMWIIFGAIQLAFIFQGVKYKSKSMFLSMLISLVESITIITIVIIRQ